MRRFKQLNYLFGLMLVLFLFINRAMAEYAVCYVPGEKGNSIMVEFHYDMVATKFSFLNIYILDNRMYKLSYELPKTDKEGPMPTFEPKTGTDKDTIKWAGKNGFSGELLVTDDKVHERSFAKIQMPGGVVYYHTHALCARSYSDENVDINSLLPKLQKKVDDFHNGIFGTPKIPSKL
ncbi:MAG: hypothetical protein K0R14_549 [Burkholderiales bacterium]|jgi:hypothetical protein|nr:hypothetical protein [Burkholderiales bacterium]